MAATNHLDLLKQKDKAKSSFIIEKTVRKLQAEHEVFSTLSTFCKILTGESFTYTLTQKKLNPYSVPENGESDKSLYSILHR